MNILVIGGSRFFGKKLVYRLIEKGNRVTLITRGNLEDNMVKHVNHIRCDRTDDKSLEESVRDMSWDIIYDQVCYNYEDAQSACHIFKNKTKHYVFTSSQSVYEAGQNLSEEDFNPKEHQFKKLVTSQENYSEAKRQAEVAFSKYATFPVTFVRFPIVIGNDDYTNRFQFHIDSIKNKKPIFFPNLDARISFITSDFASIVLASLTAKQVDGAINVASSLPIKLSEFISIIENAVNEKVILSQEATTENHSPYGITDDWFLSCVKLNNLGLKAPEVTEWLPKVLEFNLSLL